jgi:hypothetical protein
MPAEMADTLMKTTETQVETADTIFQKSETPLKCFSCVSEVFSTRKCF